MTTKSIVQESAPGIKSFFSPKNSFSFCQQKGQKSWLTDRVKPAVNVVCYSDGVNDTKLILFKRFLKILNFKSYLVDFHKKCECQSECPC